MGGCCCGSSTSRREESLFDGIRWADRDLLRRIRDEGGQLELFESWPKYSRSQRRRIAASLKSLHATYSGGADGLLDYLKRAKALLAASRDGINPLEGWKCSVPEPSLVVEDAVPAQLEESGLAELKDACFVLVAGGLGERLGFSSIKLALPCETLTSASYLKTYCSYIKAWGGDSLVIMTSDDTHAKTKALIDSEKRFGLSSIFLLKQDKVASIVDSEGRMQVDEDGLPVTKPHGHGDVHSLLFRSKFPQRRWKGKKWVVFFQDTNALAMLALPAMLGVSARDKLKVNTMTIRRLVGREMGALARLTNDEGSRTVVTNVEYNQLRPMLDSQGEKEGEIGEPSLFPGNCNCFVVDLNSYSETLTRTRGDVPEFVNPKYEEDGKTFAKATRLECMMQDYPKLLPDDTGVGFTMLPEWLAYSPVKNNPTTARNHQMKGLPPSCPATGEADLYHAHSTFLRSLGCLVEEPRPPVRTAGDVFARVDGPWILLAPEFASTRTQLSRKIPHPENIKITNTSALVVRGKNVVVEDLDLDGALVLDASSPGSSITVKKLALKNKGARLQHIPPGQLCPDELKVRGFKIVFDQKRTVFARPGERLVIRR